MSGRSATQSPLVVLLRGGCEEVTFYGELVVANEAGLLWSAGEAVGAYPMRSLLKPFQFLACDLPADRWQGNSLQNIRYAPCVGSVSATVEQMEVIDAWYRKGKPHGFAELVQVPPAVPIDPEKRVQSMPRGPQQKYHMCFSKHAAIVEACEVHGWDSKTYLSPGHPYFRSLCGLLERWLGRDLGKVKWVTDGCQLPTPLLSLTEMARLYQSLASEKDGSPLGWVRRLMLANPDWIGSSDRMDSRLMKENAGKLVAKEGADGLLGLAVLPNQKHPQGLGIVVKMATGFDTKATALSLAPLLDSLGLKPLLPIPPGHTAEWKYKPFAGAPRKIIDISPLVSPQTAVWPGDISFRREVSLDTLKGNHLTLSSITTTVHVGAHADAPNHFEASDRGIESVDISKYFGPCQVIELRKQAASLIVPADLTGIELSANRVLFKTGSFPDPNHFNEDFVALSGEVVDYLTRRGVCLIGVDTPSVDAFASKDLPAHHATLRAGVAVLEGIVLDGVSPGLYQLAAVPLKLAGADASPVRAILF